MIISATLTNSDGCQFDSLRLEFPAVQERGAVRKIKNWAAGRGGRYTLDLTQIGRWEATCMIIGQFYYTGQCRRAVAAKEKPE